MLSVLRSACILSLSISLNIYSFYSNSRACFAQADKYTFQVNGTIAEKTREMRELDAKLSEP